MTHAAVIHRNRKCWSWEMFYFGCVLLADKEHLFIFFLYQRCVSIMTVSSHSHFSSSWQQCLSRLLQAEIEIDCRIRFCLNLNMMDNVSDCYTLPRQMRKGVWWMERLNCHSFQYMWKVSWIINQNWAFTMLCYTTAITTVFLSLPPKRSVVFLYMESTVWPLVHLVIHRILHKWRVICK